MVENFDFVENLENISFVTWVSTNVINDSTNGVWKFIQSPKGGGYDGKVSS